MRDFYRKSRDLERLLAREVDVMVAVVPNLLDRPHRTYHSAHHATEGDTLVGAVTAVGREFAEEHGLRLVRRIPVWLSDPEDGRVELTVLMFVRDDERLEAEYDW
jgi:hypothetical protein